MAKSKQLKVKLLAKDAKLPTRNHDSAGVDLYVTQIGAVAEASGEPYSLNKTLTCYPNRVYGVRTGIAVELPEGYFGLIKPRSGVSLKNGMMVGAGVVDNDYRGEILVVMTVEYPLQVKVGDKIAQLVMLPYLKGCEVVEAKNLSETGRGEGGFGSSG
jgi:dUTP pyrophosphatase